MNLRLYFTMIVIGANFAPTTTTHAWWELQPSQSQSPLPSQSQSPLQSQQIYMIPQQQQNQLSQMVPLMDRPQIFAPQSPLQMGVTGIRPPSVVTSPSSAATSLNKSPTVNKSSTTAK